MAFLERLDLHIPLGEDLARLLCDLLRFWRSINWATVCLDVPRSKVRNLSHGRSSCKGGYVWVYPGSLTIVTSEEAKQRRASSNPSNPPSGAPLENPGLGILLIFYRKFHLS